MVVASGAERGGRLPAGQRRTATSERVLRVSRHGPGFGGPAARPGREPGGGAGTIGDEDVAPGLVARGRSSPGVASRALPYLFRAVAESDASRRRIGAT